MRRPLSIMFVVMMLAVGLGASPAGADRALAVSITAEETIPSGGEFVASGPAEVAGLICPEGTTSNVLVSSRESRTVHFLEIDKTFTCADGSGTFTMRLNVKLDPDSGETTAAWWVTSGTGDYSSLRGTGRLVGTPGPVVGASITDDYRGRLK